MATNLGAPGSIIEDEEAFLEDVEQYMKQRGVAFDREGKVAGRPAPLHKLYKMVLERGGYDAVSDTRMAWRDLCTNFSFPKAHDGAMAYQLKQLYYKNLTAYEIEKYWGEIPPPPNQLELITAKGSGVRTRLNDGVLNLPPSGSQDMDEMDVESPQQTPKQGRIEPEDQGSASRYPSRLRQQPKPVQLYQPDPTPSRSARMRNTNSPQPAMGLSQNSFTNSTSNPRDPNFRIENYEPRPSIALSLRPLVTPSSNPDLFYQRKQTLKIAPMQRTPLPQDLLRFTLPKAAFDGPNIYVRCVQGLRSGIRREQDFALHHLVKVSHERGDKFKFEGFPTLAEALLEKVVEVTELAFGVPFQVSYMDGRGATAENTLNAVHGTEDLALRLGSLAPLVMEGEIEPDDYIQRLEKVNEATLVVRNMVTLEDNAIFLSKMALFRDLIVLILKLPKHARFDEMKQYALDMAEMTSRYWNTSEDDDLYNALVEQLASGDRGRVIRALGAIYRFDAEADRVHPITNVPQSTLEEMVRYCMLDDDELVEAVVNFLYAWSAFPEQLGQTLKKAPELLPSIIPRLCSLLVKGAMLHVESICVERRQPLPAATLSPPQIPAVPQELFQQLLGFNEPERSSRWLRCCFEEAQHADVTQISIWQAYQQRFIHNNHIPAADFIKQVSATIQGAQAQVVQGPQGPRFIIKGIKPRRILLGLQGQPYYKCHWEIPLQTPSNYTGPALPIRYATCASWHSTPEALWKHLLGDHSRIPTTEDGKFQSKDVQTPNGGFECKWYGCQKNNSIDSPGALGRHLRIHLLDTPEKNRDFIFKMAGERPSTEADVVVNHTFFNTALDEKNLPMGIPFMSALLLCNIARHVGRFGGNEQQRRKLMSHLFSAKVRDNLWTIFSKQKTIAGLIMDVIQLIAKGETAERKNTKPEDEQRNRLF